MSPAPTPAATRRYSRSAQLRPAPNRCSAKAPAFASFSTLTGSPQALAQLPGQIHVRPLRGAHVVHHASFVVDRRGDRHADAEHVRRGAGVAVQQLAHERRRVVEQQRGVLEVAHGRPHLRQRPARDVEHPGVQLGARDLEPHRGRGGPGEEDAHRRAPDAAIVGLPPAAPGSRGPPASAARRTRSDATCRRARPAPRASTPGAGPARAAPAARRRCRRKRGRRWVRGACLTGAERRGAQNAVHRSGCATGAGAIRLGGSAGVSGGSVADGFVGRAAELEQLLAAFAAGRRRARRRSR